VDDFSGIAVPVEINAYLYEMTIGTIEKALGAETKMRMGPQGLFVTDNGNHIVDCTFNGPLDMDDIHNNLIAIPGVVETGIFNRKVSHIYSFDDQGAHQEYKKDI
jgi:ribose 5-phosphate isomerase A